MDREDIIKMVDEMKDKLVIVEGKRDRKALKTLGIENVFSIDGQPLYYVVQKLSDDKRDIVILTDFDRKGKELNSKLIKLFNKYKRQPNKRLRNMFMSLGKNKIEDLKEVDVHVKVSSNFNKIYNKGKHNSKRYNRKARCDRRYFWSD